MVVDGHSGFFCDQTHDLSVIGWYLKPHAHVIIILPVTLDFHSPPLLPQLQNTLN